MCLRNPLEKHISSQQCEGASQTSWAGEQTLGALTQQANVSKTGRAFPERNSGKGSPASMGQHFVGHYE